MCGILLAAYPISSHEQEASDILNKHIAAYKPALRSRGPDKFGTRQVTLTCRTAPSSINSTCQADTAIVPSNRNFSAETESCSDNRDNPRLLLHLAASLLQLRGASPSTSPLTDTNGNILCFNGEVFTGLDMPPGSNDGKALFAALRACIDPQQVVSVLSKLRGPWSLVYWQQERNLLWLARDWLGRRSLLAKCHQFGEGNHSISHQHCMVLTSVAPSNGLQQQRHKAGQGSAALSAASRVTVDTADTYLTEASSSSSGGGSQHGAWIEVPPGIYSISSSDLYSSLTGSSSSSSTAGCLAVQPSTCTARQPAVQADGSETPANCGILTPADLCAMFKGLQHHEYDDPQIHQLQQYVRQQQHIQPDPMSATVLPDNWDQQQQQQQQASYAARIDVSTAVQEAARPLLRLLQASVDVRCLTIHTLQQQQQQQHYPTTVIRPCQNSVTQHQRQAHAAPSGAGTAECLQHEDAQQQQQQEVSRNTKKVHPQVSRQLPLAPAPVLILFSGGVDSTLIAALAHLAVPPEVPIDLSNVCFVQGNSPDRQAAHSALLELAAFAPDRQWRLIEVDSDLEEVDRYADHIRSLLHPAGTVMDLNIGAALWLAARAEGRVMVPVQETAATAAAAGSAAQQIANGNSSSSQNGCSGDHEACSTQQWRLVPVELPSCSAADSPAGSSSSSVYKSAARVVLLGHGADEQCGGYGRHRTKFRFHGGWQALADELALDVKRLWIRNLGRDDRLIADHGREGRHPFLDEHLMTALLNMPLPVIADLNKPIGAGDKQVLRQALAELGIPGAAGREKRAIQFGSRIGKLSNKREFGSNRKANILSAGQIKLDALQQHKGGTS